ncbi:hypothetical protein YC2023_053907 [Brassica napus]
MISRTNLVDSVLHFVSVNSRRVAPRRSRRISRDVDQFSVPSADLSPRRFSRDFASLSRRFCLDGASVSTVLLCLISNAVQRICGLTDSVSLNTKEKKVCVPRAYRVRLEGLSITRKINKFKEQAFYPNYKVIHFHLNYNTW